MCYSVLVQTDLKKLKEKYTTDIAEQLWNLAYEFHKNDPKKIKLPGKDQRIYPKYLAPIIYQSKQGLLCEPMIYSAHLPHYLNDQKSSMNLSTFNARLDSLDKRFWAEALSFGRGLIMVQSFFEWVRVRDLMKAQVITLQEIEEEFEKQRLAHKEAWLAKGKSEKSYKPTKTHLKSALDRDVVIQFFAKKSDSLAVPVIFNSSKDCNVPFKGFAIITNDPNPEIERAGHDRMPIVLDQKGQKNWLNSFHFSLAGIKELFAQQQEEIYFDHKLA